MCSLAAITINRYVIICHNRIYDKIYSTLNVTIMIIIMWLFSFGVALGAINNVNVGENEKCLSGAHNNVMDLFVGLYFILPIILMIVCYVAIFLKVKRTRKELGECLSNVNLSYKEEDMQLLKMISIIFVTFFICLTPMAIVNFGFIGNISEKENAIIFMLFGLNFIINPFIYGFKNKVYRPAFISLYQKICKFFYNKLACILSRSP